MTLEKIQRISIKIKCPNPLFQQWLTEWRDKAAAKESKMQRTFETALQSLKKYPLPLESGTACKILIGFGDKLCKMLDEKLIQYRKFKYTNSHKESIKDKDTSSQRTIQQKDIDEFIPQYGTGSYAILLALYTQSLLPNYPGFLKKADIIQYGTQFVNNSFTKPNPGTRYTTWGCMKTLLLKKLVLKVSHPPKFSLTDKGTILAIKLYTDLKNNVSLETGNSIKNTCHENNTNLDSVNNRLEEKTKINEKDVRKYLKKTIKKYASESDIPNNQSKKITLKKFPSALDVIKETQEFSLLPHQFEVILIVDVKEVSGKQDDEVLIGLRKRNILHEVKDLKVGDFTWICREHNSNKELILPYIIERKRMDDFAASIKDKRYHEQKFRLKKSGIENLTYLVESYGKNQNIGLPLQTLYQAASYTAIQESFFIKFTEGIQDSIDYLATFSEILKRTFQGKILKSCNKETLPVLDINQNTVYLMTFKEFNESSIKNKKMNVTDLFTKMLIQIKGMSVERALAITKIYPTPIVLKQKYAEHSIADGERLLANIKFGGSEKCIGIILSRIIYNFFNSKHY